MDTNNPESNNIDASAENVEEVKSAAAQQTDDIDWKLQSRKHEERAKENFAAAQKWKEYEESQKSEDEKRYEELAQVRLENASLKTEKLKSDIALKYNVPSELLFALNGSTEEELSTQAEKLVSSISQSAKPNKSNINPEQGKPNGNTDGDSITSWVNDNLLNK
jgi:hypothetical protein